MPSSPVYWLALAGILLSLGYAIWVIYSALKARDAEPAASFVSLACLERMMGQTRGDGTRHFLVQTHLGFPNVEQFEHVLPADESTFRISYSNDSHSYAFRMIRNLEGEYDVFILKAPAYGDRPSDEASSFRLGIGTPRERLAFAPGGKPTKLPDCVRKAIFWAEANSHYIVTGSRWAPRKAEQRRASSADLRFPGSPMGRQETVAMRQIEAR